MSGTSSSVSGSGVLHANRTLQTVFLVMTRGVNSAVGALIVGAVRLHMSNLVTFEATYGGSLDGSRRWSRARHRLRRRKDTPVDRRTTPVGRSSGELLARGPGELYTGARSEEISVIADVVTTGAGGRITINGEGHGFPKST